jgi:hypothetical protein
MIPLKKKCNGSGSIDHLDLSLIHPQAEAGIGPFAAGENSFSFPRDPRLVALDACKSQGFRRSAAARVKPRGKIDRYDNKIQTSPGVTFGIGNEIVITS